jgi:hypothetical protein
MNSAPKACISLTLAEIDTLRRALGLAKETSPEHFRLVRRLDCARTGIIDSAAVNVPAIAGWS